MRTPAAILGIAAAAILALAAPAVGQFGTPGSSNVAERIVGTLLETDDGPVSEQGDQIGAFAGEDLAGIFTFESADRAFSVLIFGDDPNTAGTDEGPDVGDRIRFRFFDASTNETSDLDVINASGERFNLTFQGAEVPALPVPLPGLDLTPTREFNLRAAGSSGGGGDGGGGSSIDGDVNGDGRVDTEDAALVLRLVVGGGRLATDAERTAADVNGDNVVSTADAILILRNR